MPEILGAALVVAALVGVVWLFSRLIPKVRCTHCGSRSWIIMGDMKQCRDCGRLFV